MIHAIDLILGKMRVEQCVQERGRNTIAAKGFFHNDPPPAATVSKACRADHRCGMRSGIRWNAQIKYPVRRPTRFHIVEALLQYREVFSIARNVAMCGLCDRGTNVLREPPMVGERLRDDLTNSVVSYRTRRYTDDANGTFTPRDHVK